MTPEQLKKLIDRPECAVVEFKIEYKLKPKHLDSEGNEKAKKEFLEYKNNEFVKDLLSLLNRDVNAGEKDAPSYLIIGVSDNKQEIKDATPYFIDSDDIRDKLRNKCKPPVTCPIDSTLEPAEGDIDGKKIWVIRLAFSPAVHALAVDLPCLQGDFSSFLKIYKNKRALKEQETPHYLGEVFIRDSGITTLKPSDPQIQALQQAKNKIYEKKKVDSTAYEIPISPYKGLLAFTDKDTEFFFGREKETAKLVDNIKNNPFILLYW